MAAAQNNGAAPISFVTEEALGAADCVLFFISQEAVVADQWLDKLGQNIETVTNLGKLTFHSSHSFFLSLAPFLPFYPRFFFCSFSPLVLS